MRRDVTGWTGSNVRALAAEWYELFNVNAGDLYPGRYTHDFCEELAETAREVWELAAQKESLILPHYYQYPELHEVGDFSSDSLRLALKAAEVRPKRIDFSSVHFMAEGAKILLGDATRVFVQGDPRVHSCSLVLGTNHQWVRNWKRQNPTGVLCAYINCDLQLK